MGEITHITEGEVLPSITTCTDGKPHSDSGVPEGIRNIVKGCTFTNEKVGIIIEPKPRNPQKHRQYWAAMRVAIEQGGMIRSKAGILKLMDFIEEEVG